MGTMTISFEVPEGIQLDVGDTLAITSITMDGLDVSSAKVSPSNDIHVVLDLVVPSPGDDR